MEVTVGAHPVAFLESVRRREAARSSESLAHAAATTSSTVASDSNGNGTWDERTSDYACHGNGVQFQQTNPNGRRTRRCRPSGYLWRAIESVICSHGRSDRCGGHSATASAIRCAREHLGPQQQVTLTCSASKRTSVSGVPQQFCFFASCSAIPIIASPAKDVRGRRTGSPSADRA